MPKGDKKILKADPEDGTTPIANLLLEAVAIAKLSGKEKGAILYLWRRTYGWKDKWNGRRIKERIIPLSEWQKVLMTNDTNASTIISKLVKKDIFKREFLGPGKGYIYRMNTEIQSWNSNIIDMKNLQSLINFSKTYKSSKKQELSLIKKNNPPLSNSITPLALNTASLKKDVKKDIKKGGQDGTNWGHTETSIEQLKISADKTIPLN